MARTTLAALALILTPSCVATAADIAELSASLNASVQGVTADAQAAVAKSEERIQDALAEHRMGLITTAELEDRLEEIEDGREADLAAAVEAAKEGGKEALSEFEAASRARGAHVAGLVDKVASGDLIGLLTILGTALAGGYAARKGVVPKAAQSAATIAAEAVNRQRDLARHMRGEPVSLPGGSLPPDGAPK